MSVPITFFYGTYDSSCGYCGKGERNPTKGLGGTFFNVSPKLYENMIYENWRRSGKMYYQPQNEDLCCPQYAIRLDVEKFHQNKKHRGVWRRMERYLDGWRRNQNAGNDSHAINVERIQQYLEKEVDRMDIWGKIGIEKPIKLSKMKKTPKKGVDLSWGVCVQMQALKKEIKATDLAQNILSHLKDVPEEIKHISVSSHGHLNIELHTPLAKTQKSSPYTQNISLKDELEYVISPSAFLQEEYEIYREYQIAIHGDEPDSITKKSYERFLCTSSILTQKEEMSIFPGLGSYHIQYRFKKSGEIIGVSVVDILPSGLSSVYFFYNPKYHFLSPGIWSVLFEIDLLKKETFPNFKYLYLGFYIHSCQKMRYKAQYKPSELRCPVTGVWVDLETCVDKVFSKGRKYGAFSDAKPKEVKPLKNVFLLYEQQLISEDDFRNQNYCLEEETENALKIFKEKFGNDLGKNIAYYVERIQKK